MEAIDLPTAMIDTVTTAADWVVVLPMVLLLLGAAGLLLAARAGALRFILTLVVLLAVLACEATLLLRVYETGPVSMTMGKWQPPFGVSLTVDLFGAAFALAATLVTLAVLVFGQADPALESRPGFYPLVLMLLTGITGSFLTGDLFNLYVWFEVMLVASFGLMSIGARPIQLDATLKYGFLNFLATALFLLSLGLLYGTVGTLNMADILRVAPAANPVAITGVASLLLLAFGMKAAAFPVNAWLPASYHAPPVAISALMAGLLTKVGAYALLRALVTVLPASRDLLEPVLLAIAVATLVIAPLGAIAETNLRRALGFLVIGGIGAILAGLAIAGPAGIAGAGAYVIHSMLTLSALYLVCGLIERHTGQTDTRHMGGVYATSTPLSIIFLVLMLGVAGLPPLLGFWPKLLLLEAGFGAGSTTGTIAALALLLNAFLTLIAGSRLWAHIFWRSPDAATATEPARAPGLQQAALAALTVVIVAGGLWPNPLVVLASRGAADMVDPARYVAAVGLAEVQP
jgi:multicomponent Na+:H+ antiporter subunit D